MTSCDTGTSRTMDRINDVGLASANMVTEDSLRSFEQALIFLLKDFVFDVPLTAYGKPGSVAEASMPQLVSHLEKCATLLSQKQLMSPTCRQRFLRDFSAIFKRMMLIVTIKRNGNMRQRQAKSWTLAETTPALHPHSALEVPPWTKFLSRQESEGETVVHNIPIVGVRLVGRMRAQYAKLENEFIAAGRVVREVPGDYATLAASTGENYALLSRRSGMANVSLGFRTGQRKTYSMEDDEVQTVESISQDLMDMSGRNTRVEADTIPFVRVLRD